MKPIITLVLIAVNLLVSACAPSASQTQDAFEETQSIWPTKGWKTSTPEEQGFDSTVLYESLQELWKNHALIDSVLIVRNGYLLLDAYFYPYEPSFPHNLASVTKSITTSLIGIAAGQGRLQLSDPMISFFPERIIANLDNRKEGITVGHLAGMVNGMTSGCLQGDVPTLESMFASDDWVQTALDRKVLTNPGAVFCYDSPGMHLLSAILQAATGMTELEFAQQYLFQPLGIQDVYWESDPQGYTHGWGDLWLKPPDAAKIGYLFLNQGVWEGKQIIPSVWIADAIKMHIPTGTNDGYGYGWWVAEDSYFAQGRLGQYIRIYPATNAVVVVTARGFIYETIEPVLAAYISPDKPLPANPEGVEKLNNLLTEVKQGPGSEPVTSTPAIARQVSGKTYNCAQNPATVTKMRLEFNDPLEAKLYISYENGPEVVWPIGLDGKYRMCPEWKGVRGYWMDEQTLVLQALYNNGLLNRNLQLSESRMVVNLPDRNLSFTCQAQTP